MAGFADIVRNGVALADSLTQTLQARVTHEPYKSNDGEGGYTYGAKKTYPALVEKKAKITRNAAGEEIVSTHVVTILRPIKPPPGRTEPIDQRDRFTLPDKSKPKILHVDSFTDADTNAGYFHQVYLG